MDITGHNLHALMALLISGQRRNLQSHWSVDHLNLIVIRFVFCINAEKVEREANFAQQTPINKDLQEWLLRTITVFANFPSFPRMNVYKNKKYNNNSPNIPASSELLCGWEPNINLWWRKWLSLTIYIILYQSMRANIV